MDKLILGKSKYLMIQNNKKLRTDVCLTRASIDISRNIMKSMLNEDGTDLSPIMVNNPWFFKNNIKYVEDTLKKIYLLFEEFNKELQ